MWDHLQCTEPNIPELLIVNIRRWRLRPDTAGHPGEHRQQIIRLIGDLRNTGKERFHKSKRACFKWHTVRRRVEN